MALPDPIAIAASAPTPAVNFYTAGPTPKLDGMFRVSDVGPYGAMITHNRSKTAGERHYVKITETKDAVNPYTGGTAKQSAFAALTISIPPFGWTQAEKVALVKLLTDFLADAEVTVAKILMDQS